MGVREKKTTNNIETKICHLELQNAKEGTFFPKTGVLSILRNTKEVPSTMPIFSNTAGSEQDRPALHEADPGSMPEIAKSDSRVKSQEELPCVAENKTKISITK